MELKNKHKQFIEKLTKDQEVQSIDINDNVVTLKTTEQKHHESLDRLNDEHTLVLKRRALWETAQKCMAIQPLESGEEAVFDPIGAVEAIAELNKLDGHYAPIKYEHTYIVTFTDESSES